MTTLLGNRLREERLRLDLSQTALAATGGVGKSSQILYESGKRVPDANYLIAVAKIGVDIDFVLLGERKVSINNDQYLNADLLTEIIDAVDTWASQRKSPVTSKIKGELIALFYKQFHSQHLDHELMSRHLKLVG